MLKHSTPLLLALILSCSLNSKPCDLEICSKVASTLLTGAEKSFMMTSSSQMKPSYRYNENGIFYSFCINEENAITFLSTNDKKFNIDKIAVGATYKSLVDSIKSREYFQAGWGYVVEMTSGWKALFSSKSILQDKSIDNNSVISCFYKESYCK